jgi:hypothetical protein
MAVIRSLWPLRARVLALSAANEGRLTAHSMATMATAVMISITVKPRDGWRVAGCMARFLEDVQAC